MKRLLALVAAIAACLTFSTTAFAAPRDSSAAFWRLSETTGNIAADTAPEELVTNPSFETTASDWASSGAYFFGSSTLTRVTDSAAPDGSWAAKVETPAQEQNGLGFDVTVSAGRRYTVRVKLRRTSGANLKIALAEVASPYQELVLTTTAAPSSTSYTEYTGTVTPARSGTYRLYVRTMSAVATTFYADAMSVREDPELVTNPSFETTASDWASSGAYFFGSSTLTRVTDSAAPDGSWAAKVETPAQEQNGLGFDVTVSAGRRYTVRVKLRRTSGANLKIALAEVASPYQELVLTTTAAPSSTSYTEYTGTVTPARSGTYRLYVRTMSAVATTFYADAMSVREGNPGTYTGGYTLGQHGVALDGDKAVLLDGSSGRLTTAYSPFAGNSVRSFEGWAKRKTSSSDDVLIAGDDSSGHPSLRATAGGNDVSWSASGSGSVSWTGALPGTGEWFHWALVYDDSAREATLYVNGVNEGNRTLAAGQQYDTTPGNIELGAAGSAGQNHFDGYLDEVAVYERALSAPEVSQLAAELSFNDSFEGGSFPQVFETGAWCGDCDDNGKLLDGAGSTYEQVTPNGYSAVEGTKVAESHVEENLSPPYSRSEIQCHRSSGSTHVCAGGEGSEFYYDWWMRIPSGQEFVSEDDNVNRPNVMQTKPTEPTGGGDSCYGGGMLATEVDNPALVQLSIVIRGGVPIEEGGGCEVPTDHDGILDETVLGNLTRDAWHHIVLHAKWSEDADVGFNEVTIDGVTALPKRFGQNFFGEGRNMMFRPGIYATPSYHDNTVQYDNVIIRKR